MITKDEIILVITCDHITEKRVLFLAALPVVDKYFSGTSVWTSVMRAGGAVAGDVRAVRTAAELWFSKSH